MKDGFKKFLIAMFLFGILSVNYSYAQTTDKQEKERPTVGVVLCGGGAKGFAHISLLKALDEAGVPIDYIAGTSIGSIIGSLYAIGYDPDVIEELVRKQDWDKVIYDRIPVRYMPIDKKIETRKYLASFPIKDGKIKVKSSVVDGVYVNMLMSRLMLPAYNIHDYSKLPVPFFCIATDVVKATQYEMTEGDLSRSVRASMSIPFLFKPVKMDGKVLIDGGMINNFPVRNMKERGVDIIIGIDIEDFTAPAEQIDNSLVLLTSLMNLSSLEESTYGRHNSDIYIRPNLHGRNMMSFGDFDSIIYFGKVAADQFYPEFKKLADSLQEIHHFEINRPHVQPVDTVTLVGMKLEGIPDNHKNAVMMEFGNDYPKKVALDDMEEIILKLSATGYYENFWYNLEDAPGGFIFKLHCEEIADMSAAVAIHYDNDFGIGALVNFTVKNFSKKLNNATLSFDLNIAENPYLKVKFHKRHRRMFRYGADLSVISLKMQQYDDLKVKSSYSIQDNKLDIYAQLVPNLNSQIRIGAVADVVHMKDLIGGGGLSGYYNLLAHTYFNYYYQNLDAARFAHKGWRVNFMAKMVFYQGEANDVTLQGLSNKGLHASFVAYLDLLKKLPLGPKNSLKFEVEGGTKVGTTDIPLFYKFFVGGQSRMNYFDNIISFAGLSFTDRIVNHFAVNKIAWQWNFYRNLYSTLHLDYGFMSDSYSNWIDHNSFVMGAGVSLGVDSLLGPIEVCMMMSNIVTGMTGFINVGYWF